MPKKSQSKPWKQRLTKKQREHLNSSKITYKWQLMEQKEHIKKQLEKHPQERIICWECREILNRLGLWKD